MSATAWVAVVWGACAPLSIVYCVRTGFLERNEVLGFRIMAALWVGPLVALVATASAAGAGVAHLVGAAHAEQALSWWRPG
jgi:hypothetical protein